MTIPDYQTLMLPVLRLAADKEQSILGIIDSLADKFNLTEEERAETVGSGSQTLLSNRAHWAKTYLVKAGLLEQPRRGRFVATKRGREILATRPERIDNSILMSEGSFSQFIQREQTSPSPGTETISAAAVQTSVTTNQSPEDLLEAAQRSINVGVANDALIRILQNSPAFFERLIIDLLVAMGYGGSHANAARNLGRSGDGGVDGVIDADPLGINQLYVQAKRYAPENSIGRPVVQGFVGSLVGYRANVGVFVTTSSFAGPAREYVKALPQRVILIDGKQLVDLMMPHKIGVRVKRSVDIFEIDENVFVDE
jgi:restriction system protein